MRAEGHIHWGGGGGWSITVPISILLTAVVGESILHSLRCNSFESYHEAERLSTLPKVTQLE